MSYPFFSGLSVFLPGYPFYLTAIRFFVSFWRKQKHKNEADQVSSQSDFSKLSKVVGAQVFLAKFTDFPLKNDLFVSQKRGWPGIFRDNHHRSQFLVLVFFLNDGSNSKSHFLNENKNDDGFLASLGANRRRSYFHSVFHIMILTIVPEGKNWPNPCE